MVAIKDAKAVWEMQDRYGHARAIRINQPTGQPTEFSMVYGKDEEKIWRPVRPVSDRYQPISTALIVDAVKGRFNKGDILTESVRLGTRCTKQVVKIVLDLHKIKIGGEPADLGTQFTQFGSGRQDIWRPIVQVRNAYDGTSSAQVSAGWFRVICSNGLVVEAWKGSTFQCMRIHTVNQIPDLVEKIGKFEFGVAQFKSTMGNLVRRVMSDREIKALQDKLPKNYEKDLDEAPHKTAYDCVNFMLYLQSHEMSIDRGKVLQPLINSFIKAAA